MHPIRSALFVVFASSLAFAQTPPPADPAAPAPAPAPESAPAPAPAPTPVAAPPAAAPAPAASPSAGSTFQTLTLNKMLEKGLITQAEYDSAVKDLTESIGAAKAAGDNTNFLVGKFSTSIYGFAEGDVIYDSTQGFTDIPGAPLVARPGSYSQNNGQLQFSVRNARLGLRFRAPEYNGIRVSAQFEGDFAVTVESAGQTTAAPYNVTEGNFFTNPIFRIRHYNMKIESPVVDVLIGQTWHLFGWQGDYMPNTVQPQGVPGELYSRTPQVRLSKSFKGDALTFDAAVAAMRPTQRASSVPDGEAGVHLALNKWTGIQTVGATGGGVAPLSFALTGVVRQFNVPEFNANPVNTNRLTTPGFAFDAFIPVIPGDKDNKGNSLSLLGEVATGASITDMYTSMASGVSFPNLPTPPGATTAPTYNPLTDPGYVTYDAQGFLHPVEWNTYRIGAQYYFPGVDGKIWASFNYSYVISPNAYLYGTASKTLSLLDFVDGNIMGDLTPSIRLGIEYCHYATHYADGVVANDHRVYASGFFLF